MYLSCLLIDAGDNPDRPRPGRLWLRNLYRVHQRLCMAFPATNHDKYFLQPYEPAHFPDSRTGEKPFEAKKHLPGQRTESHVHVERSNNEGFLFRVDPLSGNRAMIVVQSAIEPKWEYTFQNVGINRDPAKRMAEIQDLLAAPPQVQKDYQPKYPDGTLLGFRLLANATHKVPRKEGIPEHNARRRVPVQRGEDDEGLKKWLTTRAEPSETVIGAPQIPLGFHVEKFLNIQTGYVGASRGKYDADETRQFKRFFYVRYDGVLRVTDSNAFYNAVARGIGPAKGFGFGLLSIAPVRQ